jgi:hypothetical protein
MVVAADAAVLVSIYSGDPRLAISVWFLLLATAIGESLVAIYRSKNDPLFLPICSSKPEAFYDFYYRFYGTFKGDEQSWKQKTSGKNSQIFNLHYLHCPKDQCRMKEFIGGQQDKSLEAVVTDIIDSKKGQNIGNRILWEMWNLELGKKVNVTALMQKPQLTTSQDYMLFCLDQLSKDSEISLQSSESNKEAICKAFYDLLIELADHYSQFYDELAKN